MAQFSSPGMFHLSQKMYLKIWTRAHSKMSRVQLKMIFIFLISNSHVFLENFLS
jgi:hypothetical protein